MGTDKFNFESATTFTGEDWNITVGINFRTTCTKEIELVKLRNGIPTFNGYSKQHELVKVGLMYMVGDVPGIAKEQNRVQQNAKSSCGHCTDQGIHSKILDKTVYSGGRKFLTMDNPMRQDTTFPSGSVENGNIIKRTVEEEKVNARYLDHHHQEQQIQGNRLTKDVLVQHEEHVICACEDFRFGDNVLGLFLRVFLSFLKRFSLM